MEKIKIQNKNNPKIVKEVEKKIATDYLNTNEWEIFEEKKIKNSYQIKEND